MMPYTFINQLPRQLRKGVNIYKKQIEEFNKEILNLYYTDCQKPIKFDPMCTGGIPLIMTKLPSWCYYNNMTLENFITLWMNKREYNNIPKVPNVNMTKNRRIYDFDDTFTVIQEQNESVVVDRLFGEIKYQFKGGV